MEASTFASNDPAIIDIEFKNVESIVRLVHSQIHFARNLGLTIEQVFPRCYQWLSSFNVDHLLRFSINSEVEDMTYLNDLYHDIFNYQYLLYRACDTLKPHQEKSSAKFPSSSLLFEQSVNRFKKCESYQSLKRKSFVYEKALFSMLTKCCCRQQSETVN